MFTMTNPCSRRSLSRSTSCGAAILLAVILLLAAFAQACIAKVHPDRVVASPIRSVAPQELTAAASTPSGPLIDQPGCEANVLPANDDGSTGEVELPFELNFFGSRYSSLWVNNNGNVTFGGPMGTYTPFDIESTTPPMIAPFFADVDTRGEGSGLVTYGTTTFEGRTAFCVDWLNVGYFAEQTDKLNDFQLVLVDRSDAAPGDFDIVFNYGQIQWETGDASGGSDGLGGISAGAGYSNGDGDAAHFYQLPGSLENGALLDSNQATGLVNNDYGTSIPGRYRFHVTGPGGGSGEGDFSRPWPLGGYGYSFPNKAMGSYLRAAHLGIGDVMTRSGLDGVFSDWSRDAALVGGSRYSIAHLGAEMEGGVCFGLALSGGRFDGGLEALSDASTGRSDPIWAEAGGGPSATVNLPEPGGSGSGNFDRQFLGLIGDDFVSQISTQVNGSFQRQHYAFADPTGGVDALRNQLESVMGEGRNLYDYSGRLSTPGGNGFAMVDMKVLEQGIGGQRWIGHEVLAYSMEPLSGGGLKIDVWDNDDPFVPYAIEVAADDSWDYNAPDGPFQGEFSMSGAPGEDLGVLAVLPLFNPTGLTYYPEANGGLGSGSLVDVGPEESVASARDGGGEPVDVEPITADGGGDNGAVLDLPSDSGEVELEGDDPSLDVRGEHTYMTAESSDADGPVTFSTDEREGAIEGDEGGLVLSVARGQRVVTSEGAGGLEFDGSETVITRDASAHLRLVLEFPAEGSVVSTTLFDGSTSPGSGMEFSSAQLGAAEEEASARTAPAGGSDTAPPTATQPASGADAGQSAPVSAHDKKPVKCRKIARKKRGRAKARCVKIRHRSRNIGHRTPGARGSPDITVRGRPSVDAPTSPEELERNPTRPVSVRFGPLRISARFVRRRCRLGGTGSVCPSRYF